MKASFRSNRHLFRTHSAAGAHRISMKMPLKYFLVMMACASLSSASLAQVHIPDANEITTIAGNGTATPVNGVSATSSGMYPVGVAVDSMGNFYIADQSEAIIQKVTAATGIITTVAGNGTSGCTGDGGPATSAELGEPMQVAVDGAGNIYIADLTCHAIREVTKSTGIITTVAGTNGTFGCSGDGGPATSALVDGDGVAVDGSGNIYVVGYGCEAVRKVDASTGIITTVAGNGSYGSSGDGGPATSASLGGAIAVAIDGQGNLYIATYADNRVRKVTASDGVITTVAGNGTSGFSGDGGPATGAELYEPSGVAVDGVGNIFIADTLNERVRLVIFSTGVISTFAGNGTQGFSGDGGVATSAELYWPEQLALDLSGNLYIPDQGNHRIRSIGAASVTGYVDTKYQVLTIGYAPPGHLSTVKYSNNSTIGTSNTLTNTLKVGVGVTVTDTVKTDISGISSSGQTSASADFSAEGDTSESNAVTFKVTRSITIPGVGNDATGVDHTIDQIYLWVNPKINLTTTSSPNQLLWNGYAYDSRDPALFDWFYVTPQEISLNQFPAGVATDLQRSWDSTLGPVTLSDLQYIENQVDPFIANPSYNPNNDPNARYDLTSNVPLLYEPPGPCPNQPINNEYFPTYGSTSMAGQSIQVQYDVGYVTDTSTSSGFNVGDFTTTITNDFKNTATATITAKYNVLDMSSQEQSADAIIWGPSCSAGYTGGIHEQVWKDNAFGTFMWWTTP
jgi:hypothetical protein